MSVVEVDDRFRLTLPKNVRGSFRVSKGQKLYVVSVGDALIIKRLPTEPSKALDRMLGEFNFDKGNRGRAEEWLLKKA